jgi:adenosylhomocysteine nucleosidase
MELETRVVVLISADAEWRVLRNLLPEMEVQESPLGEWFAAANNDNIWLPWKQGQERQPVVFFHGGWGKIAAAASTQYVIDRWHPTLLVNLGTCGGFEGEIERGTTLLVDRTLVYDIIEQMGDFDEHIAHYTTEIDLSWVGEKYPMVVRRSLLVSGDRDLLVEDIPELKRRYGACAGDWESGAIAFVAARNQTRLLILRGVTDLVGGNGSEAYGNLDYFSRATQDILRPLVEGLPAWLERAFTVKNP